MTCTFPSERPPTRNEPSGRRQKPFGSGIPLPNNAASPDADSLPTPPRLSDTQMPSLSDQTHSGRCRSRPNVKKCCFVKLKEWSGEFIALKNKKLRRIVGKATLKCNKRRLSGGRWKALP